MKKLLVSFILFFLLFILFACTHISMQEIQNDRRNSMIEASEQPFVIFYTYGTGSIIQNFQFANPELNIEYYRISSSLDDMNGMNDMIAKVGEPDLVILHVGSNMSDVVIRKEYAADITEYLEEDTTIDLDDYLPETFEVLNEYGYVQGLPLGISLPAMTIREEKWIGSAFDGLDQNYSGMELLSAIEDELDNASKENIMFSGTVGSLFDWLYLMGAIQETDEGVEIDEQIFERVYTVYLKRHKLSDQIRYYFKSSGRGYHGQLGVTGLDPSCYEGNFVVSEWDLGAPQVYLPYANSVNMDFYNQKTHTIYYPTWNTEDKFGASVEVYGIINKNSNRQHEAYELLRMMMDTRINYFVQPFGFNNRDLAGETFFTPNIDNMYAMIDDFEEYEESWLGEENVIEDNSSDTLALTNSAGELVYIVEKIPLDNEEKEKLINTLSNISYLYLHGEREELSFEIEGRYISDRIEDYKGCYTEFTRLYNSETTKE